MQTYAEVVASFSKQADYSQTLAAVCVGHRTCREIVEVRAVPMNAAAASLARCYRKGLLSRTKTRPYVYSLTTRGQDRLDWLRNKESRHHVSQGPAPAIHGGQLPYTAVLAFVDAGCKSTPMIAQQAGVSIRHASASATRIWRMGLLTRRREGRRFIYAVSPKGMRFLFGLAKFPEESAQFNQDYSRIPHGETAKGRRVILMAKLKKDMPEGDWQKMTFQILSGEDPRIDPIDLASKMAVFKTTASVLSPPLAPGGYKWTMRRVTRDGPGEEVWYARPDVFPEPDFIIQ